MRHGFYGLLRGVRTGAKSQYVSAVEANVNAPLDSVGIPVLDGEFAGGLVSEGDAHAAGLAEDAPRFVLVLVGMRAIGGA